MGFRSYGLVENRRTCIATHGWRCSVQVTQPQPQTEQGIVSVGGGSRPLFPVPPGRVPAYPELEYPVEAQDVRRRARTLAASMGVVVDEGGRAEALAATLALLLDELKGQ